MSGFFDPVSQVPHKVEEEVTVRHADHLENHQTQTELTTSGQLIIQVQMLTYLPKKTSMVHGQKQTFRKLNFVTG